MSTLNVQDFPTDPLASAALTGTPTAPTQPIGDNSTNIATTAFVQRGYRLNRVFWITASGTYTPTAGTRTLYVEAIGGGGAGASAKATSNQISTGGGGAAGGYSASWLTSLAANYSVTIGAGGTAASAGGNGGNGGDTIFGSNVIVAKGGGGGQSSPVALATTAGASGTPGTGGVGDVSLVGNQGGLGWGVVSGTTPLFVWGGDGGAAVFSGKYLGPYLSGPAVSGGNPALGYGGGSCGGANWGTNAATTSQPGNAGACRIWEFF